MFTSLTPLDARTPACGFPPPRFRWYASAHGTQDDDWRAGGAAASEGLAGWALDGDSIPATIHLPGFPDALAFVVRLGFDAEAADHHPDILINYKRVTLTYTTHSEGGLTDKDFAGAARRVSWRDDGGQ